MTVAAPDVKAITVAGRTFRPVTVSTMENQLYMMPLVRAAGLTDVGAKVAAAESDAAAEALLYRVIASRHTLPLLAGVLIEPEAERWSPEGADRNQRFFADLTDPRDIAQLQAALVALVANFFGYAGNLPATSATSSPAPAIPFDSATSPTAATSPSGNGDTSLAPSPTGTRTRSRASSGGRSGKPSSLTKTG